MTVTINGTTGIDLIQDNTVSTSKIQNGAVIPADLSTGAPSWDSSGNLSFNSGYGSVANAYACRAWVNFNGTGTVAIRGSANVSSITDVQTGRYWVNFANSMPDTNYSVAGLCSNTSSGKATVTEISLESGRFQLSTAPGLGGAGLEDSGIIAVSAFR